MQAESVRVMNQQLMGTGFMLMPDFGDSVVVCNEDGESLWRAPSLTVAWQEIQDCMASTSYPVETLN